MLAVVGREIKVWITRAGIKQKDLAQTLGLSSVSISEKLRGKTLFSLEDLIVTAGMLGITLGELLGENIINAKIPSTAMINNEGEKKSAPIRFIPTGATYHVVAGTGFEPATSGL
ncbi:helix-turn-helix transcriptional regulator [Rothia sp. P13129]|uniref:helix-turn-helix transcriptional regulator n=1 Tax=Rothia sp. P13129 TaxID=3402664 RepID=UPI003ACB6504